MKFKVGDKVKYIGKHSAFIDYNSVGIIVSIEEDAVPYNVQFSYSTYGTRWCAECNLIKILSKNQQLLFSFM